MVGLAPKMCSGLLKDRAHLMTSSNTDGGGPPSLQLRARTVASAAGGDNLSLPSATLHSFMCSAGLVAALPPTLRDRLHLGTNVAGPPSLKLRIRAVASAAGGDIRSR